MLLGYKLDYQHVLRLEEIDLRALQGKLKKFQEKSSIPKRNPHNLNLLDIGKNSECFLNNHEIQKKISLEKSKKNDKKLPLTDHLKVFPAKIIETRDLENSFLKKRRENLTKKYYLSKKKVYI